MVGLLNHRTALEEIQKRLKKRQNWRSVAGEIQRAYVLTEIVSPFSILLHLANLEPGDKIAIQTEIELFIGVGTQPKPDDDLPMWVAYENHELSFESPSPGPTRLLIDGQMVGPQAAVIIQAPNGPWRARINYVQNFGTSKTVRYLVY